MDIQNRNKDLTQVFDDRWKANHNYEQVRQARENEKNFIDKMFHNKAPKQEDKTVNYMEARLKRLQENMNAVKKNRNKF